MRTIKRKSSKSDTTEKRMAAGCILLACAGILIAVAGKCEGMAEWYAIHIYPVIVSVIGSFSGVFPFSLSELCLYGLLILFLGSLIHAIAEALKAKQGGAVMLRWASGLFLIASILVFLYVVNCGINYRRVSFSQKAGIETVEYTADELQEVCQWLTENVNARAEQITRDARGIMVLSGNEAGEAVNAMNQLGDRYEALEGFYFRPKPLLVSEILSYQSLTGIYLPFTVEANYNEDMTDYNIPFTACHELSHLCGFMQEEEANFIAFLACIDAPETEFQYSGYLMGWIYSMNALRRIDENAWQEVRENLSESVETDLLENSRFWAKYEGAVAEVSSKVNDTYLKANGQADGVQSYDRMVDLIVAYFEEQ